MLHFYLGGGYSICAIIFQECLWIYIFESFVCQQNVLKMAFHFLFLHEAFDTWWLTIVSHWRDSIHVQLLSLMSGHTVTALLNMHVYLYLYILIRFFSLGDIENDPKSSHTPFLFNDYHSDLEEIFCNATNKPRVRMY